MLFNNVSILLRSDPLAEISHACLPLMNQARYIARLNVVNMGWSIYHIYLHTMLI